MSKRSWVKAKKAHDIMIFGAVGLSLAILSEVIYLLFGVRLFAKWPQTRFLMLFAGSILFVVGLVVWLRNRVGTKWQPMSIRVLEGHQRTGPIAIGEDGVRIGATRKGKSMFSERGKIPDSYWYIIFDAGAWVLKNVTHDLDASVNGQPVLEDHQVLQPGDQVKIGDILLVFDTISKNESS
ncbi:MAG: hypothetical protein JXJ17_07010 [Anaerolineae bacterium]|nr:hypothetical protein [Anaerolineae bacterium]